MTATQWERAARGENCLVLSLLAKRDSWPGRRP
jgi:hypothetical protein